MTGRKITNNTKRLLVNFESLVSRDSKDGYYSANDYGSA